MKTYKFSMEKILSLREDLEKEKMEKMVLVQNELESQRLVLEELLKEEEEIKNSQKQIINIEDLVYKNRYKSMLENKIIKQDENIQNIEEVLNEKREDLIEAQKARKIMEKLKEKDLATYKNKIQLEEQKELDEIAVLKYNNIRNF